MQIAISLLFLAFALGIFVLLRLVMPSVGRELAPFRGKNFAHRGLHSGDGAVPENSLAAFRAAKEQGFGVELDVQLTADKRVVVFHDMDLRRMCGVDKTVAELTFEELSALRLLESDERIPLFSRVLALLDPTPIVCELKTKGTDTEVCALAYADFKDYAGDICIESFNPFALRWFYKNRPAVIRGQLSMNFLKQRSGLSLPVAFAMTHLLINFLGKPDFIAYCQKDAGAWGFRLCRAMYHPLCIAWTVRSKAEREEAKKGFQSIIFEKQQQRDKSKNDKYAQI